MKALKPALQILAVAAGLVVVLGAWLWLTLPEAGDGTSELLPETELLAGPGDERLKAHARTIRDRLPGRGFTVVTEPPFVVVGNGSAPAVRAYSSRIVRWAVAKLKQDYFERDPADIITIFLMSDDAAYQRLSVELFGIEPTTPFGYYSDEHKAMVMNIATGGGTLVHEIVHPFVEANFPGCPAWFNEGLASLYEACEEQDGKIVGLLNWRLAGLKKTILDGTLLPFDELISTTRNEFYLLEAGDNYAQARYLLYFLEQKGLLRTYYKEFLANRERDPTGWATLKRVMGVRDMAAFQQAWEAWVMKLEYE